MLAERIMRQVENGSGELVGQNMPQVLAALLQKQGTLNTVKVHSIRKEGEYLTAMMWPNALHKMMM